MSNAHRPPPHRHKIGPFHTISRVSVVCCKIPFAMMKRLFLNCLIAIFTFSLYAAPVELAEALRNGWINLEARTTGTFGEGALRVSITNLHKPMELSIPSGWIFESLDSTYQNCVTTNNVLVSLEREQKRTLRLNAYCISPWRRSPVEQNAYASKGPASGPLSELAKYVHTRKPDSDAVQSAVWAVHNGHDLYHITQPELAQFTAKLLGKPAPEYYVRNGYHPEPGGPAYRYEPLTVEGVFEHHSPTEQTASFGLYNAAGELVQPFFTDQPWWAGKHNFKFTFTIYGFEQGEYVIRLTDKEGKDLGSKKVVI